MLPPQMSRKPKATMPRDHDLSRRAHWAGGETIATALMARTVEHPELISLAAGFADQATLPVEPVRRAMEVLWSDPERARVALQYGTTSGYHPLREILLARLLRGDGQGADRTNLSADQVVVTAGSNQLLYLVGDTLLDPGDIVLCPSPGYFVLLGTLANVGARVVGVEIDQHGVIPEALQERLTRLEAAGELGRVKLIYVTSYYDNPTGVTIPADRRQALVEIAKRFSRKSKLHVIDDIAYRDLRYYGEDIPSLRAFDAEGDTVIVAGTFSKSFSPGIRIGWGLLPKGLVGPVASQKGNIDFGSPNFNQHLMHSVLKLGLFDEHVAGLQASYRAKLDAILEAADTFLAPLEGAEWVRPTGGLYLWLRLPDGLDTGLDGPLFDRAVAAGVLYVPGEYCYPAEGPPRKKNMLRLSFGIQSCETIRQGVELLARAISQVTE